MTREIGGATVDVTTTSTEATEAVASLLATALPATGVVVGLSGPLGAGKTCFARGLASGLGVEAASVTSPTFIYLADYPGRSRTVQHADLYRLLDLPADRVEAAYESIGLLAAMDTDCVCVVEWWDHYRGPLPAALVRVEFTIENAEHRRLSVVFETPEPARSATFFNAQLIASGLATSAR